MVKININILSKIILFQRNVKKKLYFLKKINGFLKLINNNTSSITHNLYYNLYITNLITKDKYNYYMLKIEKINIKLNKIPSVININIYKTFTTEKLKKEISDIISLQLNLCELIGANKCSNVINLLIKNNDWKNNINNDYKNLLKFYDKYFICISSKLIENSNKVNSIFSIIKNINRTLPFINKLENKKNIILQLEGANIYFPINNKLIVINGYFKNDQLNLYRKDLLFIDKIEKLKEININVPKSFIDKYIKQLSIRDFIILTTNEISKVIIDNYNELKKNRNKTLSVLIKEFLKTNIYNQRKIISLFLMSTQEEQFNAQILFELISSNNNLFGKKSYSDDLFNSFHWSLKKLFKIIKKNIKDKKKDIDLLNFNDISYETRILSMKTTDNIKRKAIEKLKEINGKDNSTKAKQYLDGLLKIPFDIYHKEEIFKDLDTFKGKLESFITLLNCKLNIHKKNIEDDVLVFISNIIDDYYSDYKSENLLNNYINNIENNLNILLDKCNINKLNIQNISEHILDKFNLNNNNIDKTINKILKINDISVKTQIKKTQKKKIVLLYNKCLKKLDYYNNIKNILIKNKVLNENHINLIKTELYEIENQLGIKYNKIDENYENTDLNLFFNEIVEKLLHLINYWYTLKNNKIKYMDNVKSVLDSCVYGHDDVKTQIQRLIGQWMNGKMTGNCIGLSGPPGIGKTTICKEGISKCLVDSNGKTRPFAFLALGGSTNGSMLVGHNYTYLGSTWGKIVDILIETQCLNPIIYIDELDKVSNTEHGKEITGILTHLTDPVQNKEFQDKYFSGIPFDLSKALFIFSYNDNSKIDGILKDRIQEINVKPLNKREKLIISQKYVLPEICKTVGFLENEIIFNKKDIINLIDTYTYEAGVRKLNEIYFDIIREINLMKIMNNNIKIPFNVSDDFIKKILHNKPKITQKKIAKSPQIGLVNGLYATSMGVGGITIIEVMNTPTDKKFSIEKLTGSQGDVMKESMACALTLAWNILPPSISDSIFNNGNGKNRGTGLHIHCPEASTPKDGPSAGCAIVTAIISRICNIPIKNTIAMTGEIDLNGNIHEIGGLDAKLNGALMAGVKKVLIPFDNKKDYDRIIENEKKIELNSSVNLKTDKTKTFISNNIIVKFVKNINEVLKNALVKNDLF